MFLHDITRRVAAIALCFAVASCSESKVLVAGSGLTVLKGATLIDGTGAPPVQNAVVVLDGNNILRVGRVGDYQYEEDVSVVDLSGRHIVPGFIDVHVHPKPGSEDELASMLLAFGITTIRIPGADSDTLGLALRERIERGEIVGPRIFTGARIIEGPRATFPGTAEVHSEAEMRDEVRRQAALGVDLVKLYWNTPIEFIQAAVDEAHSLDIQVVGHLRQASWTAAAQAGIDGLLHSAADGPTWELVPAEEREQLRSLPYRQFYERFEELVDLDAPQFDSLVAALVDNNGTVDPTLVVMQSLYFGDDLSILERLEPSVAPPSILDTWGDRWDTGNPHVLNNVEEQDLTYGKGMFPIALEMVRRFYDEGVHLAVGTDVGMPWITPGVSFHRELELLTDAGIPALDVLSLATLSGAETVRSERVLGTIEPGKLADLVILRDSPVEDIRNTRSIEVVYKDGQRFEPQTLLSDASQTNH
jgi:imidazolonepropionase-like amidohydrolase